jgi:hypothetical protein
MCDPVTGLVVASAVASAAGSLQSGMAAKAQGNYEAKVAGRNASLAEQQAQDARDRGVTAQTQLARRYAQIGGEQRASMAANGLDLSFGSALGVQQDTASLYGEDTLTASKNTDREATGYDISAANYRSEGIASKMRGSAGMTAGVFGAASSVLGGATQFAKLKDPKRYPGG